MKVTKWFDGEKFAPAHVGLYEQSHPDSRSIFTYWWDGQAWLFENPEIGICPGPCNNQNRDWRGLAEKPATLQESVKRAQEAVALWPTDVKRATEIERFPA